MASELPAELLDDLILAGLQQRLTLFAGAGVSTSPPTSLPLARTMTHSIVGGLCGQRPTDEEDPFWMAVGRLRPERLLSVLHEVMGDDALTPLRLLGGVGPNRHHLIFAALADAGALWSIVTTNFDTAIEQALTSARVPFTLLACEADFATWDGEPVPLPLIKLHGSLPFGGHDGGPLEALMEQVGRPLSTAKARSLARVIEMSHLVVVGYSGRDDFDIYPALCENLGSLNCTWVVHPTAPLLRRSRVGDKAKGLDHQDFATLFAEPVLADPVERLAAADPERVHRIVTDTGAVLDELCRQLAHGHHSTPEELPPESAPTRWQREVAAWAERFQGTDVPRRAAERIRAEGALRAPTAAADPSDVDALKETLRSQIENGDVVNQSKTLLALADRYVRAREIETAISTFVACLAILSKTHQIGKIQMRGVLNTPQELSLPMAREAMGRLLGLLVGKEGWPFAEQALAELDRHFMGEDTRRYLRHQLLPIVRSLRAAELDDATCEWLRWAMEVLSESEEEIAIPAGIEPEDPEHRLELAELMADHVLRVGKPIWDRLREPLAVVDAARPRLVLDLAARWERERHLDRPLLPWFTALWLGLRDDALTERLDRLETLVRHPHNTGVQEAAAYSLRVLARTHCRSVLERLNRLAAHPDELVRGNVTRALVEPLSGCRRESLTLLKTLRRDRSAHTRAVAAETLRRVRGPLWRRLLGLQIT